MELQVGGDVTDDVGLLGRANRLVCEREKSGEVRLADTAFGEAANGRNLEEEAHLEDVVQRGRGWCEHLEALVADSADQAVLEQVEHGFSDGSR
jgi:hypothetical protein